MACVHNAFAHRNNSDNYLHSCERDKGKKLAEKKRQTKQCDDNDVDDENNNINDDDDHADEKTLIVMMRMKDEACANDVRENGIKKASFAKTEEQQRRRCHQGKNKFNDIILIKLR